jgi:hypothetical protein
MKKETIIRSGLITILAEKEMTRAEFIERLRVWSRSALREAETPEPRSARSWRARYQVLSSLAAFMEASGSLTVEEVIARIRPEREQSERRWRAATDPLEVAQATGEIAAYDLALEVLRSARPTWTG